jgi:lipid-binding SYLF domain-containing protein
MKKLPTALFVLLIVVSTASFADNYSDTISLFRNAGESGEFFKHSHGYVVFPTVGKGGLVVGAAHGSGHVYEMGKFVGEAKLNQVSVGLQAGGQAYSEIIFFEDKHAFDEFTKGNFELGADANAVAITAAAGAKVSTTGSGAGASAGKKDARTEGGYHHGFVIFTIVKGGAMYEATVSGQKFSYEPRTVAKVN